MRAWVGTAVSLVAILLLSGSGAAHVGAVEAIPEDDAVARATFEQIACIPTCDVQSSQLAYAPPATVVTSGSTVTWRILTGASHTATSDVPTEDKDDMVTTGSAPFRDACLDAFIADYDPGKAQLEIRDGVLQVLHPDDKDPSWDVCEEAQALPGGVFALSYHCTFHPRFQHGVLVVVPDV